MKRLALIAVVFLAGCATTGHLDTATQNPCLDPQYLSLRSQNPDDLSNREFLRLMLLEDACHQYRIARELDRTNKVPGGPLGAAAIAMGSILGLTLFFLAIAP